MYFHARSSYCITITAQCVLLLVMNQCYTERAVTRVSVRELNLVDFRSNYQAKNSSFSTVAMTIYNMLLSVMDIYIYYDVLF